MCGIAGILYKEIHKKNQLFTDEKIKFMISALYHRGPNQTNIWQENPIDPILAHSRLKIIY